MIIELIITTEPRRWLCIAGNAAFVRRSEPSVLTLNGVRQASTCSKRGSRSLRAYSRLYYRSRSHWGQDMRRFEDKVVLVTGAASGIGRATVERIASEGGRLFCVDVQAEAVEETAKKAGELGAEAEARVCDVSSEEDVAATVGACIERFGKLDALCNVAGILRFGHTHELPFETWKRVMAVNLDGTFLFCRAALPHLVASRGAIVNVSSTAALAGLPYGAAYGASKGGVLGMTRAIAVEYGKQGVRCNAVCPGSIKTPMTSSGAGLPEDADFKLVMRQMALDQPRGPETVASLMAFLASEDAIHINGEDILVDGGTLA